MKLSPPASSSDIELAREVARRLHQRRRREDRPEDRPAGPAQTTHAPQRPVPPPPPAAQHIPPPPPLERVHAAPRWAEEPAPPSWDSIPAELPRDPVEDLGNKEPEDALDALTAPTPDPTPELPSEPAAASIELDEEQTVAPAQPADPASFDEADAYGGSPEASPFDGADTLDTPDLEEPELDTPGLGPRGLMADDLGAADLGPDDLGAGAPSGAPSGLPEEPAEEEELFDDGLGPSWGDVVESCMSLAHASGALLADARGELVAARGEWPDPGAEAIASKLVAMMDRTLKDAPTRSVSAPVGGLHLTAWRVPVGDRLLTAAFIAESPVRAETRPSIDLEVQRGAAA